MIIREPENKTEPVPAGTHLAVCNALIDLGEQYSEMYDTYKRQLLVMWEFPEICFIKDGESIPRNISNTYTANLSDKGNLRAMLESWRGKVFTSDELKGFELKTVLNKSCLISVIHKEKNSRIYANISGIVNVPMQMQAGNAVHIMYFDMDDPATFKVLDELPEWIQKRIKESRTYQQVFVGDMLRDHDPLSQDFVEFTGALPF